MRVAGRTPTGHAYGHGIEDGLKDCVPTSGRKEPLAVQGDSYTPSTRRH